MLITLAKHPIQNYILTQLMHRKNATFSELQPPKVKTNLFSYHVKLLVKNSQIQQVAGGYTLTVQGLAHVHAAHVESIAQPEITCGFVIQNSDGDLLLTRKAAQPFIDTWTLPTVGVARTKQSLQKNAADFIQKTFQMPGDALYHAGDCYSHVTCGDVLLATDFLHVFTLTTDDIPATIAGGTQYMWVHPRKLAAINLAPNSDHIIARTFFRDPFFFEEFMSEWQVREVGREPSHL